jgi:hypothetical protein
VKGALCHSRESLADEKLGKGRLCIPYYCGQDINGCLKKRRKKSQNCLWGRRCPTIKMLTGWPQKWLARPATQRRCIHEKANCQRKRNNYKKRFLASAW